MDLYIEQMLSYNDEGSYFHYYKCPCGNGAVVDDRKTDGIDRMYALKAVHCFHRLS